MPHREGLPNAVMAIWGAIQLEPLKPDEISVVAAGGSDPGILVSILDDPERSAKVGGPVYRLAGGAGFLWIATFNQNGRGVLRYLAIDASEIESSSQVVSNQPAPAPTLSLESGNQTTSSQGPAKLPASNQPAPAPTLSLESGNQTTSSQGPANLPASNQPAPAPTLSLESRNQTTSSQGPANLPASNQPAPAPTLSLESGNQTTSSQGPANPPVAVEGPDRQRNEVQQLATISEVAIAIFVLLCGLAVAAFLRMKRVRG
jgi:hypothetical protein